MRIYVNRQPIVGPWGGGNRFLTAFVEHAVTQGHSVGYGLDNAYDAYVCMDPRPNQYGDSGHSVIAAAKSTGGMLVCRVGDVGTHGKPEIPRFWSGIVPYCDACVFPSVWARDYMLDYVSSDIPQLEHAVHSAINSRGRIVRNGAASEFFANRRCPRTIKLKKASVVTHHWSDNEAKGFDVYAQVAKKLDDAFTYIGRRPCQLTGAHMLDPMDSAALSSELPRHDVYLTASLWEAGANHVLEALACGLPVVYSSRGGSIPEYVGEMGVTFDGDPMPALAECIERYDELSQRVAAFNRTTLDAATEFMAVLERR